MFKGATERTGHWEVNRVPEWRADDWKQLLKAGKEKNLQIRW